MMFNNKNVFISKNAEIGENVRIGDNTYIFDNVRIEDNSIIGHNCIIGEPQQAYYFDSQYENPKTVIGAKALIRSHTIIYSGVTVGKNFSTGHRVTIREQSSFGDHCRVGTLSDIQGHVVFGNYCWLHSNVHIGQQSKIGNFVFIYPYVVFTNDPHPPSNITSGPTVGDYTQIAVGSILLPGIKVGKHVLIGTNTSVTKDVEDFSLILGNPGKKMSDVRDIRSRESGKAHYPWPYNFERGMPWEGIGYDKWLETQI